MKFVLSSCLMVGALLFTTQFVAAAVVDPFLAVDVNGTNTNDGSGPAYGPTQVDYQALSAAEGLFLDPSVDWASSGTVGLTNVYATSEGNITATMTGFGTSRGARDRGANSDPNSALTQDFVFAARDNAIAFGRNYIKLSLSGLNPNTEYQVTTFARDHFNSGADSFEAWTDLAALGGLDGPSAWLDANVGAGASYQPAVGGTDNPIPTLSRGAVSGPSTTDPYSYAATFRSSTDASGILTVYGWSDPNSFSGVQGATLLNGFQVGEIPEPASLALCAISLVGIAFRRVR